MQGLLNLKQPGGVLTLAADYSLQLQGASPAMVAEHVKLGLEGLALTLYGEEAPIFTLRKLTLEEGRFDSAANELKVGIVVLEGPSASVTLKSDGRINLGQMVKAKMDEGSKPSAHRPMFALVDKASISGGTVVFSDQRGPTPFSIRMESVAIQADGLGNKPGTMGRYGLTAQTRAGETLRSEGTVSLSPVRMNGKMALENVRVATPWLFVQDRLNMAEPAGTVEASARYGLDLTRETDWLTVDGASLKIKDISMHLKGEENPLLALSEINLVNGRLDLGKRAFTAERFDVRKGIARMMVDEPGVFDWERIAREPETEAKSTNPEGPNSDAAPWTVELGGVDVADIQVAYTDRSRMKPLRLDLGSVSLHQALTFRATTPAEVVMDDMSGEIHSLSLMKEEEKEKVLTIEAFSFQRGRLDLQSRSMQMGEIQLRDGNAHVVFDERRTLNWAELFASKGAIRREVERSKAEAKAEGRPWTAKVDAVQLKGFGATIEDRAAGSDASFHVKDMALSLSDLVSDLKQPIGFKMALRLEEGGELTARGVYDASKSTAETNFNLEALGLPAFTPYLRSLAPSLSIDSGQLSCGGDLSVKASEEGPLGLSFTGRLGAQNVGVKEVPAGTPLMGIEALEVPRLHFGIGPDQLKIREARLVGPSAKVVINQDQTVNVIEIFKSGKAEVGKVQKAPAEQGKAVFPVEIGRIELKGGTLDFADLSLEPQFRADIRQLDGSFKHFATGGERPSSVALQGQVNEYGQAIIEGKLYPLQATKQSEANLRFRNIDMANLTPYTAKFAGYEIRSGKLSLNLQYKVMDSKLNGENEIIVDQLVLGKRLDRPALVDLPLEMAVALLKDSSGKIDIGLPVRGDLNDPKFKLSDLIWKALGNELKKIVTAPFAFIGQLVGFKGGDLDQILFEAGRWNLSPPEREKLKVLADALKERPQLGIEITGGFDEEADMKALQILKVHCAIALKMGLPVPEQGDLEKPRFSNPATQKAIEALFVERVSPEALEALKKTFSEAGAKEKEKATQGPSEGPRPRKFQLYGELYRRLVEIESISDQDLRQLGRQRAQAASEELERQGVSDTQRIRILASASVTKGKEGLIPASLKVTVLQAKR